MNVFKPAFNKSSGKNTFNKSVTKTKIKNCKYFNKCVQLCQVFCNAFVKSVKVLQNF